MIKLNEEVKFIIKLILRFKYPLAGDRPKLFECESRFKNSSNGLTLWTFKDMPQ